MTATSDIEIYKRVYDIFYQIPRISALELSDGGGPFGFDIITAIEIDYIITQYQCDGIIETGSNLGDTTEYLSEMYKSIQIVTCDVIPSYVEFVKNRLNKSKNVIIENNNSPAVIKKYQNEFHCPLFYLDAHWYDDWPLSKELELITNGIVCVSDFDIGHTRFSFDTYDNIVCGPNLLSRFSYKIPYYYINNPYAKHPFPCLQIGRRCGKAYFALNQKIDYFNSSNYFSIRNFS